MREALEEEPNLRIVQAEVAASAISAMICLALSRN
jgi:hypothetical protein